MKRRDLVGGMLSLSVAGCLRLTESAETTAERVSSTASGVGTVNDGTTAERTEPPTSESTTETTRPTGMRSTLTEPPNPFVVGRAQRIAIRVNNNREEAFDGEVQLRVDGALRAIQTLTLRSRTATTVAFDLTLDALRPRALRVVVTGEDYETVLVDEELQPAQHAVTVEWGESYVPADDEDSSNPEDDRTLSFYCRELVLERDGEALATYDVGVFEEEPRRLAGTYRPEQRNGETRRWFGGSNHRTVIGFEDDLLVEADALRFRGRLPPEPAEMPVTVRIGDRQTDEATWTNSTDQYAVSLEVDA